MPNTNEEQLKLANRRVPLESRPKYYNSRLDSYVSISDSMQDFLILLSPQLRQSLIQRFTVQNEEAASDYSAILSRALHIEELDASEMYQANSGQMSSLDSLRVSVIESPYGNAPEVANMMKDIQQAQGRLTHASDQSYHSKQIASLLQRISSAAGSGYQNSVQRDTWITVLRFYA